MSHTIVIIVRPDATDTTHDIGNSQNSIVPLLSLVIDAVDRNTQTLESLGDNVGRNTAKWLELANLPNVHGELQEDAFLQLGFRPAEVVDLLYPNLGKDDRKTRLKAISKRRKKKQKKELIPKQQELDLMAGEEKIGLPSRIDANLNNPPVKRRKVAKK